MLCPTCLTEIGRTRLTAINGVTTCRSCSSFFRALRVPYQNWFTPSNILTSKSVNDRHPGINIQLLKNVIKRLNLSGTYNTPESIRAVLNRLCASLHLLLTKEISSFEKYEAITEILNRLDYLYTLRSVQLMEYSRSSIPLNEHVDRNLFFNKLFASYGKSLELILESALKNDSFSKYPSHNKSPWNNILELASEIVTINHHVETFNLFPEKGELQITACSWDLNFPEEQEQLLNSLMTGWSKDDVSHSLDNKVDNDSAASSSEDRISEIMQLSNNNYKLIDDTWEDLQEVILKTNNFHVKEYGYAFNHKLAVTLLIAKLPKALDRDWITKEELINYIKTNLSLEHEECSFIIDSLSLTGHNLREENAYYFEFRRINRIIRKPLVAIPVGNTNAYFVSPALLGRAALHLQIEYCIGNSPEMKSNDLKKAYGQISQGYADYFVRKRVSPIFVSNGFICDQLIKEIDGIDLKDQCGELDVVAYNPINNQLYVVECKHRSGKHIHTSHFRKEIQTYTKEKGYLTQLVKKVQWVTNNTNMVLKHLKVDCTIQPTVKGLFVTTFFSPVSLLQQEIEILTIDDLAPWCATKVKSRICEEGQRIRISNLNSS
ncbi:hypothetical protein Dform_01954 [Dehalogenimonas formicexedens]|uniref:NERD domain-containing protein n=3 Tax=Dehalococcoidaceae TaxID=1202464 RepID=A0A1P8F9Z7_9CHLR|nr:hypothetical protein Dform_01954 [Dehalogenimonas formicexedens]KTB49081.1 hypothetical protein DEALK_19300 [Dehalogenimonas alkenigignens]